ncbi:hypothetical protein P43SY_004733 [Pythium insidiosum]|uniref:Uncharacterized protein n=1 Tax=Pythium insidiosum TaxID=114742 RepID=A0AAD5LUY5_PYTIN|nr:hypothetical protein P43SY_004733 [Pythium insidiosum]
MYMYATRDAAADDGPVGPEQVTAAVMAGCVPVPVPVLVPVAVPVAVRVAVALRHVAREGISSAMSFSDEKAPLDAKDLDFLRHLPDLSASADSSPSGSQPSSPTRQQDWRPRDDARALVPSSPPPLPLPLPLPLPKRFNWTRRLVVTKQPASEFYKDEGGKSNALEVEVTLVEFNELGEPSRSPDDEFVDIPLRILLFFESGKRVDDSDQEIFRFVGNEYDSVVIRAATRKALVQFRLEKVSRRKDGQRFKLRIEVDEEQCTANVADLTPIFTNAICVLSKRKHHHQHAHKAPKIKVQRSDEPSDAIVREPPIKVFKTELSKMEEFMDAKMSKLAQEVARMHRQIQVQTEQLSSPTSSDASVVEIPPSTMAPVASSMTATSMSIGPFAEF